MISNNNFHWGYFIGGFIALNVIISLANGQALWPHKWTPKVQSYFFYELIFFDAIDKQKISKYEYQYSL